MAPDFLGYEGDKHEGDVLNWGVFYLRKTAPPD